MHPTAHDRYQIPLLQLQHLTTARNNAQGQAVTFLSDISCICQAGELTAVIGPSGGGKSSLLRLINRLEDPSDGTILLAGRNIRELPPSPAAATGGDDAAEGVYV